MKKQLKDIRNQILYNTWEEYKNRFTMEEVANLFVIPLKSAYRIIRQQREVVFFNKKVDNKNK